MYGARSSNLSVKRSAHYLQRYCEGALSALLISVSVR